MDPVLELCDVSKHFYLHERKKHLLAFDSINFAVDAGQLLAITGPSGVGKSSILKCIYRSYLSDTGAIWFRHQQDRINLADCSEHTMIGLRQSQIGYVSQFLHCLPRKSARAVVAAPLIRNGDEPSSANQRAEAMLENFNLPAHLWDVSPHTFSGGEKQRVNLARGFVLQPKLLLVDEPTASLDPQTRDIVIQNILEIKQAGTTVVGIFHDKKIVKRLADAEYVLTPNTLNQSTSHV
jgi:alpha-D-ribose 1-methylphosphonate 5-triphosphate synthase subunit PhnL